MESFNKFTISTREVTRMLLGSLAGDSLDPTVILRKGSAHVAKSHRVGVCRPTLRLGSLSWLMQILARFHVHNKSPILF